MATWAEFLADEPAMGAIAAQRWPGIVALDRGAAPSPDHATFDIAYLATVRADGSPRVHPFCPILAGGRLFAAIPRASPKGRDLRRDPRCAIHALPGPDDDELGIRALALEVVDADTRAMVGATVARSNAGGMVETVTHDALFEFDLQQVDVAHWINVGQPGTHAVRQRWQAHASG